MTVFGYARVSTSDQNLPLQPKALSGARYEVLVCEKGSGKSLARPELGRLLSQLAISRTTYYAILSEYKIAYPADLLLGESP